MKIEGSVALVTGANRGLGAAFAEALLDRGAAKVYAAVRDVSSVTDRRLSALRLDLTDRASIEEAARAAADVGVLINNAGVDTHTPTLGDEAGEDEVLADEFARHVRGALSGPLSPLYPALATPGERAGEGLPV